MRHPRSLTWGDVILRRSMEGYSRLNIPSQRDCRTGIELKYRKNLQLNILGGKSTDEEELT